MSQHLDCLSQKKRKKINREYSCICIVFDIICCPFDCLCPSRKYGRTYSIEEMEYYWEVRKTYPDITLKELFPEKNCLQRLFS